jgi:quercetin dioxygenase-like cupin family protein
LDHAGSEPRENPVSDDFVIRVPRKVAGAAVVFAVALCAVVPFQIRGVSAAATKQEPARVRQVLSQSLPDIPGKDVTAVLVSYAPGAKSPPHHHAGDVFAFVVAGAVRSENSATGPAKIYRAGEAFFEPAGSKHLVSENASATQPAKLLAVFVADAHAQLTTKE